MPRLTSPTRGFRCHGRPMTIEAERDAAPQLILRVRRCRGCDLALRTEERPVVAEADPGPERGFHCRSCDRHQAVETVVNSGPNTVRRHRRCPGCRRITITQERPGSSVEIEIARIG